MIAPSSIIDAGADHDMGLDEDVAANLRVERQEHRFRRDQRRALDHCAAAEPILQRGLRGCELNAVVDAHDLASPRRSRVRATRPRALAISTISVR